MSLNTLRPHHRVLRGCDEAALWAANAIVHLERYLNSAVCELGVADPDPLYELVSECLLLL